MPKKGSWSGGKAPAQGGTPQKISKPEGKKGKLTSRMSFGKKRMTVTKGGGKKKSSPK